ncbi:MAG TPA: transglutaminase family protein [Burkholderiales bacterium]|nr:transglutaminase family protein [Burkholderiales bacterium]
MRLQVLHETHYRYSSPVVLSQQLLHLTPRTLPWQACRAHRVTIEPQPGEFDQREDYYGNPTVHVLLAAPHEELLVRAESEVSVEPREQAALAAPQTPWETLRDRLHALETPPLLEPAEFVYESPHVETWRELAEYAAKSFLSGRGTLEAALDLARRIHKDITFDKKATSVSTPLRQVLKQRRGVCQDFAHLMIGCLRTHGLAARYVSGYILTDPPPGRPRLIGADASHAWVSAYCGEDAGWVDIDPTNDCVVDDEHVTLGWGRDFGDVTPMRGVILGGGEQELEVRVTVAPVDAVQGDLPDPGRSDKMAI